MFEGPRNFTIGAGNSALAIPNQSNTAAVERCPLPSCAP